MIFSGVRHITLPEGAVKRIAAGNVTLWKSGRLPAGYTEVSFIETDGNSWIDTGITASDHPEGIGYRFSGSVTKYLNASGNNYLWGCYIGGSRSGNTSIATNAGYIQVIAGNDAVSVLRTTSIPSVGEDFDLYVKISSDELEVAEGTYNGDGMILMDVTNSANGIAMPEDSIYLFYVNGLPAATKFCGKLYSFTMEDSDGELIRDFVPAVREADSAVGLYDTVSKAFFENAGTGFFIPGNEL